MQQSAGALSHFGRSRPRGLEPHVAQQKGEFPKPIKLGVRASAWVEREIDEWLRDRIAESRATDSNQALQT